MPIMVMEAMVVTAMVAMDIQDTTEANALLMPMLTMVMATVVDTDMVDTDIQDTTEASAPLMPTPTLNPKLKPKPKLSHGMDMVTAHTHMLMVDTDTHMPMPVTTTFQRDLLMPNPTTAMLVTDMVVTDTAVVTDTTEASAPLNHTTDMADKKLSSLHYLNFLN